MSSPGPDLNLLFTNSSGEDAMEHEELSLLDDSLNTTEKDHKVHKGDADMEVSPTDQLVIVPEAMIAPATGNQGTSGVEEESETEE